MDSTAPEHITRLLAAARAGERTAAAELLGLVYDELRRLAHHKMAAVPPGDTLQPTALINEAYLRLAGQPPGSFNSKEHFLAVAAGAMRKILIDHARQRRALKRGFGHARVSLELVVRSGPREIDIREVDEALNTLAKINERASRIVELRFFAGLSHDGVARVLGVSRKTVVKDWTFARRWLAVALAEPSETAST